MQMALSAGIPTLEMALKQPFEPNHLLQHQT